MARSQLALGLLALCLLRLLVPLDLRGGLALLGILALPYSTLCRARWANLPVELLGAAASGLGLCGLALHGPEIWLQTGLSAGLIGIGALALGVLGRRSVLLVLGLGVLAPLALGVLIAALSPGGRLLLAGALGDFGFGLEALQRASRWLALALAVLGSVTPAAYWHKRYRWLVGALAATTLAIVLLPRILWLGSTLSLPTDLLIWSEPPLLLNLLKLREGEAFYGPFARLNSYSYSPMLEHLQYFLLRPLGLELSLRAHRALGVGWQLLASLCLAGGLTRYLEKGRALWCALVAACLGVLFSSLLAPHLHPDHLLMLCVSGAFWLVMRDVGAGAPKPSSVALLVALPILATMAKLTGAGVGLGLVLAYLWERDFRRVAWLAVSGVLALSTIAIFDVIFGHFSDYAIRLQASHPLDIDRASMAWATPPLLLYLVAVAVVAAGARKRSLGAASPTRAAVRVLLVTLGIGLTSFMAYAKHGGRENSLLPFALGGLVALMLTIGGASETGAARPPKVAIYGVLAALLALVTPLARPVLGAARADALQTHATLVSWLSESAQHGRRVFTTGTAAYLAAGGRRVPDASLATFTELELGKRPEVSVFVERVRTGYYDGLMLPASTLRVSPLFQRLLPSLQRGYRVVGPAALGGAWPTGYTGFVIVERRAPRDIP